MLVRIQPAAPFIILDSIKTLWYNIFIEMRNIMSLFTELNEKTVVDQYSEFWDGSTYEFVKQISSSKGKGVYGEKAVGALLKDMFNFEILSRNTSDQDLVIKYKKKIVSAEVKLSTAWGEKEDNFCFQQVRMQEYDVLIMIGFNPNDYKMYWCTKADLEANVFGRNNYRQHGGKKGDENVYWLRKIEPWFKDISKLPKYISKF
jgi:hypothetical protein